jgi:hypothetical protein
MRPWLQPPISVDGEQPLLICAGRGQPEVYDGETSRKARQRTERCTAQPNKVEN